MKNEKYNYQWPCKTCEFGHLPPSARICCDCDNDGQFSKWQPKAALTKIGEKKLKLKNWLGRHIFPYRVIALVQAGEDPEIELEWKMTCLVSASRRIYDIQRTHIANSLKGIGIYSIKKNAMISWTMGEKK